jgi:type I thyroxine 5'-deiodinase
MYKEYRDRAEFFIVYIREAHPSDSWQVPSNLDDDVVYSSPSDLEERSQLAQVCVRKLAIEIPALLDGFDDPVDRVYMGWPDRLYVIGRDGRVAFKSTPGPFGFEPERMRSALLEELDGRG